MKIKIKSSKLLGRGGMGAVYLAERDQAGVSQRVAIKVLNYIPDNDDTVRRFRQERQILARLEHPHIARLYDGGRTTKGKPCLVMEYVEGRAITEYCDGERLSVSDRIELFLKVCEALAYAHQCLIVHRDIKPGNVLVTNDGMPKLVDFGIAKPLEALNKAEGLMETATRMQPMTPNYASPEQIRDEPITTATDVYGAGVLLYELLTGHSPYAGAGEFRPTGPKIDVMNQIAGQAVTLPSTMLARQMRVKKSAVSTKEKMNSRNQRLQEIARQRGEASLKRLKKRFKGDLDNILAKALAKAPQERYGSMEAFAGDIRRYLVGRTVSVRPASLSYRTGKFIRRNPWPLTAVFSVVLFSLVLGIVMTWEARVIAKQRDRAELAELTTQKQKAIAERAYHDLRRQSYVDAIETADDSLSTGLRHHALSALDKIPIDLRNWEWGWLVKTILDGTPRQPIQKHKSHQGGVGAVYFDRAGNHVLSSGLDGQIKIWRWPSGQLVRTLGTSPGGFKGIVLNRKGDTIYGLSADGNVVAWNLTDGKASFPPIFQKGDALAMAHSSKKPLMAVGMQSGDIIVWDTAQKILKTKLIGAGIPVTAIDIDGKGSIIAAGQANGEVKIRSTYSEKVLMRIASHSAEITSIKVSLDGTRVITGSRDYTARVWDLTTGTEVSVIVGHEGPLRAVSFSPDGHRVITGSSDGEVKVCDIRTGMEIVAMDEEQGLSGVCAFDLSPDGKTIVVGDDNGFLSWFAARDWRIDKPGVLAKVQPSRSDIIEKENADNEDEEEEKNPSRNYDEPASAFNGVQASSVKQEITAGKDVKLAQRLLQALDIGPGPIDGIVGSMTRQAIRAFQVENHIVPDGRLTVGLLQRLSTAANRPLSVRLRGCRKVMAGLSSSD